MWLNYFLKVRTWLNRTTAAVKTVFGFTEVMLYSQNWIRLLLGSESMMKSRPV
jgi:hypothetical protein